MARRRVLTAPGAGQYSATDRSPRSSSNCSSPSGHRSSDDASLPPGGAASVIHHLYAIVERLPAGWCPPMAGIAGASVVPRRVDDFVVLFSLLESVPVPNPRTLA